MQEAHIARSWRRLPRSCRKAGMHRRIGSARAAALALVLTSVAFFALPAPAGAAPLKLQLLSRSRHGHGGANPHFLYGCSLAVTSMNFGGYNTLSSTPLTSTGTVTVTCNYFFGGGNITVTFSTGSSGTYTARTMRSAANTLNYNLYTDAGHTMVLGDGTNGTDTFQATLNGGFFGRVTGTATYYGLLPARQNVPAGSYMDALTATLTF